MSKAAPHSTEAITTVDIALFTISDGKLCVVVQSRDHAPFKGVDSLVGGFIHPVEDEDAEAAARRILRKKLGVEGVFLEQLKTFSGAKRDPRGWSVSIAYFAVVPESTFKNANRASIRPVQDEFKTPLSGLGFDHDDIVRDAVSRIRGKGAYSTIPARLLPSQFTFSDLETVYEICMARKLDTSSFRRKVEALGLLRKAKNDDGSPLTWNSAAARRPAQVYELAADLKVFERSF